MNSNYSDAIHVLTTGSFPEAWEAAKALVKQDDVNIAPRLIELLDGTLELERRIAITWTLGFLRASAAVEPLIRLLETKSEPPALRDQAAESLGYLWDSAAREALIRNLSDENTDVVFSCVFALRTVGTIEDIPYLERLSGRSALNSYGKSIAQEAREAMNQIKARSDVGD